MLSLALAVLGAGCNALSSVLQRLANIAEASRHEPFGFRLLVRLARRPVWLAGVGAMVVSFLLQAAALGLGELSAVEPVLALELPLTLMIGAALLHRRLHARDYLAAVAMAAGLALMIAGLDPQGGDAAHVDLGVALLATAATVAGVLALASLARGGPVPSRAALYGCAAGSGFGLTASLLKLSVARLSADGVAGFLSAWETYAFVLTGLGSLALVQAALNAGTLVAAQPGITLLDPLVSVLWGTVVAGEQTRTGPILILAGLGGAIIVLAALSLAGATARADLGPD
jgi:drug/metabolite transporter (DMT)-like permease